MCLVCYQLSFLFPPSCYRGGRGGSEIVLNGSPSAMMKCVLDNWGQLKYPLAQSNSHQCCYHYPTVKRNYPRVVLMLKLATDVFLPFVAIAPSLRRNRLCPLVCQF